MESVYQGVIIGILATIGTDIWAVIVKHVFHLPTANWALAGRWFGHMPRGRFAHKSISDAKPLRNELAIGWLAHYAIGVTYGIAYLAAIRVLFSTDPSLKSALLFGLATLAAPWLLMQPGMGLGFFASRTPRPAVVRLVNLSMHLVFGASLFLAWLLL